VPVAGEQPLIGRHLRVDNAVDQPVGFQFAQLIGQRSLRHAGHQAHQLVEANRTSFVKIPERNAFEAWGKNAAYHFVFTRQNRGKLDALTNLVERGLIKPVIGAVLPLARVGEAHELLEAGSSRGLRGKVAIDVVGQTVELPTQR
jgi:NADPH:quinone reductase-like Zn-dependent oxidoreductase